MPPNQPINALYRLLPMIKILQNSSIFLSTLAFTIISMIMLYCTNQFAQITGMKSPQFGLPSHTSLDQFNHLKSYFQTSDATAFYTGYFYADMFFILSITLLVVSIINKFKGHSYLSKKSNPVVALAVIGALAWISDIIENLNYLIDTPLLIFNIELIKIALIAMLGIGFLWWFLYDIIFPNFKILRDYLKASSISLLCLMIMALGLTLLPQGATLIVDIFEQESFVKVSINLIILLFLTNVLAVTVSHFPIFLEFAFNQKNKVRWQKTKSNSFFKIITYVNHSEPTTIKNYLRYTLGIASYAAMFYVIMKAFSLYGVSKLPAEFTVLFSTIFVSLTFYYMWYEFRKDKIAFLELLKTTEYSDDHDTAIKFMSWLKWFWISFWLGAIMLIIWVVVAATFKWHYTTLLITVISFLMNTLCFCLFRLTRSYLIFYLGDNTLINQVNKDEFNFTEDNFHSENRLDIILPNKREKTITNKLKKFFGEFSSNVRYIDRLNIAVYIVIAFFLYIICLPELDHVSYFSGISILLAFMITIYGTITACFKVYIYYTNVDEPNPLSNFIIANDNSQSNRAHLGIQSEESINFMKSKIKSYFDSAKKLKEYKAWRIASPLIIIILVIGYKYAKSTSTIHKMEMVSYNENSVSTTKFINDIKNHLLDSDTKSLVQIASYGGGLKANLWNLLILNELNNTITAQENSPCSLMERTISLSGVSGGMVGIGNYVAFKYVHDAANPTNIINKIGKSNIVSYDIAGLLGHDLIYGLRSNKDKQYHDRSDLAMKHYWDIIKKDDTENLLTHSLNSTFKKLYDDSYRYPAIIVNSASSNSQPGVGISLSGNDVENIFPGYKIFQNPDSSSDLSFYDAISTSNRFPIMSPAAQVEDLGHFLDGGYFENSGLFTSDYFAEYIHAKIPDSIQLDIIQVSIINSQSDYIKKFIKKNNIKPKSLNPQTNIQSIISGITDIDKLPRVLRSTKQGKPNYHEIYLPHLISVSRIESILNGTMEVDTILLNKIKANNEKIKTALLDYDDYAYPEWGIVEPPLARTLSKPAMEYQKAMIYNHQPTKENLESIVQNINYVPIE